ncbi:hypothetical protein OROMI_004213 [Orobanche minor]
MGKKKEDIAYQHCEKVDGNRMHLICKHCGKNFWGGVTRMKHHLAGSHSNVSKCLGCPEEVRNLFLKERGLDEERDVVVIKGDEECFDESDVNARDKRKMDYYVEKSKGGGKLRQKTMNEMVKKRDPVVRSICRMLYKNALSFNLVKCPLWKEMLEKVGEYGRGLKGPSYHEARVTYLKKEIEHVHGDLDKYKKEWKKTGCTLMSDGWTDGKSRHLTNFLVNSPSGTVFLKSIDTSSMIKDGKKLFEMLDSMIEEIGEENVVQVVTDSASAYVLAGRLLEEKRPRLFWSPCAAHCIDLMLEDVGHLPIFLDTIKKAKEVYIYRHNWVLYMFRKFSKKRELTRPGVTRFATAFLTLRSFMDNKHALRKMFLSEEWLKGPYASKGDEPKVRSTLLYDDKFWKAVQYCLSCATPLCKVLRLVDGDVKPAMGYLYEAMDRAKEQIAKKFNNNTRRYKKIWDIIDLRWDLQLHRPLHAAGYYLNPRFHYDDNFKAGTEVKVGLYKNIERMCPNIETRIKIDEQLEKFRRADGLFGMSMATATIYRKLPGLWWESYGEECKELQELAIKVLSLTCSATGCERNWSIFDLVHSERRNRLEQQRLNALVFVKYNIQLELRQRKRGDNYDPICLSDMESDDEWITEVEEPCLAGDTSWMDVHECFGESSTSNKRKRGPRNLNANKKGKQLLVDEDDEVEYISDGEEEEAEFVEDDNNTDEEDVSDFDDLGVDDDEDE